MSWDREAWLAQVAGEPKQVQRFAGRLASRVNGDGRLLATNAWLKYAQKMPAYEATTARRILTGRGLLARVRTGSHTTGPSEYELIIPSKEN